MLSNNTEISVEAGGNQSSPDPTVTSLPVTSTLSSLQPQDLNHGTLNMAALMRGSLVFAVVCVLVIVYGLFRVFRSRRRSRPTARYNMVASGDDYVDPLCSEEEDDEASVDTLFRAGTITR